MIKNIVLTSIVFAASMLRAQDEKGVYDISPFEVEKNDSYGYPRPLEYFAEIYGLEKIPERDSIRFLWMRSFHPTILFTVVCDSDSSAKFTARKWSGENGWTNIVEKGMSRELHLKQLKRMTDELGFFELPRRRDRQGLDGSTWIIQVDYNNKNHWIDRWSPTRDTVAWLIGTELIGLTIESQATPIY